MGRARFVIVGKAVAGAEELRTLLAFMGHEADVRVPPRLSADRHPLPWQAVFIDGWEPVAEVQALVRTLSAWPDLPLVLVKARQRRGRLPADMQSHCVARLSRPFRLDTFQSLLDDLDRHRHRHRESLPMRSPALFRSLTGTSAAIEQVRTLIERVAPTPTPVLITGETGTGKEVVARNLHYFSYRPGSFVVAHCGTIPPSLLESELFGREKEAFTGAGRTRRGRFEQAEGGTLFLDEITDLPAAIQLRLLRVLEEHGFERVGSCVSRPVDVRLIAATHRRLEEWVRQGRFREDLLYRLCAFPIHIPPLRERIEDLPLLLTDLNARLRQERGVEVHLSQAAMACLQSQTWPGNVRELANLIEQLGLLYPNRQIEVDQLPVAYRQQSDGAPAPMPSPAQAGTPSLPDAFASPLPDLSLPPQGLDLKSYLTDLEQRLLRAALRDSQGVVTQAAKRLGLRRTTLVEKLRRHGLMVQDPQR